MVVSTGRNWSLIWRTSSMLRGSARPAHDAGATPRGWNAMKIVKIEDLHCDAGWRVNSFLKITTDEGLVGWSEYMEGYGAQGLTGVIQTLAGRFATGPR